MFDKINDFTKPIVDFSNFDLSQLSDALIFGGSMLLIGMATVFAVLIILWICLIIFKLLFHDLPSRKKAKKKAKKNEESTVVIQKAQPVAADEDDEIIAVIAAAIAMAEEAHPDTPFRVVSFRRI